MHRNKFFFLLEMEESCPKAQQKTLLIKHFHGEFWRHLSQYYHYEAFVFLLLLLLSTMPIDSSTWYARISVFQSTKIVT